MGRRDTTRTEMPEEAFLALRGELLRATALLSCAQTLDLADVLHTVIRARKSHHSPRYAENDPCDGHPSFEPRLSNERSSQSGLL